MKFLDLGLSSELLQAIADVGYDTPTPIQQEAIPVILTGRDVLGCAQTGTGKTAGFTLPMIETLARGRAKARMPRSLILAPTRELATQVAQNFELYGKHHRLTMARLVGGESFSDQEKILDRGVDVLIATPGRFLDMFDRGRILLNDVKILVIDEADRMLDMGFIPDVERIVGLLPKTRQTLFFSATMAPEIKRLADAFLVNPKEISVSPPASTASAITQRMVVVNTIDKREALRHILRMEDVRNALIFCNRKRDVEILYRSLAKHGFPALRMHGDMPQSARTETLDKFKNGEDGLMVCSDVAARGLDIAALPFVFNFDVPIHAEDYVHRIGRTGRAGREGNAVTFATPQDGKYVAAIEKLIGKKIPLIEIDGLPATDLSAEGNVRKNSHKNDRSRNERKSASKDSSHDTNRQPARTASTQKSSSRHTEKTDTKRGHRRRPVDEFGIGEMTHPDDVIGFGQHLPNFIVAPITFPSKSADSDSDDGAEERSVATSDSKKMKARNETKKKQEKKSRKKVEHSPRPAEIPSSEKRPDDPLSVVASVPVELKETAVPSAPDDRAAEPAPVVIETPEPSSEALAFEAQAPEVISEDRVPVEKLEKAKKKPASRRSSRTGKADDTPSTTEKTSKSTSATTAKKAAAPRTRKTTTTQKKTKKTSQQPPVSATVEQSSQEAESPPSAADDTSGM